MRQDSLARKPYPALTFTSAPPAPVAPPPSTHARAVCVCVAQHKVGKHEWSTRMSALPVT